MRTRPALRAVALLAATTLFASTLSAQTSRPTDSRRTTTRPTTAPASRPATRPAAAKPSPELTAQLLAEWADLEAARAAALALARKVEKDTLPQARANYEQLAARTKAFNAKLAPLADASTARPGGPAPKAAGLAKPIWLLKTSNAIHAYNASKQPDMTPDEYGVFAEVNDYRQALGLLPVEYNLRLRDAARGHSAWMKDTEKFDHEDDRPGYHTLDQRVSKEGYPWRAIAENIALGQPTPARVVHDWFESPGHHHNLVGDYTHMGVAKEGDYWTQNFASGEPPKSFARP